MSHKPIPQRHAEYMQERWFAILCAAVEADPRGRQGVAERLGQGCGRAALSLVINGNYPARPDNIARRVLEIFDRYHCPYLGVDVQASFCLETNAAPVPTWDPAALDLRRRCQTCEHRPGGATQADDPARPRPPQPQHSQPSQPSATPQPQEIDA